MEGQPDDSEYGLDLEWLSSTFKTWTQVAWAMLRRWLLGDAGPANQLLITSCKTGDVTCARAVLWLCRADPNLKDGRGNTVASLAVQGNHPDLTCLLLSFGAEPNLPSTDGFCPLHSSVVEASPDLVGPLLAAGASPFQPGAHGFTPLHTAVAGGRIGLVEMLLTSASARLSPGDLARGVNQPTQHGQTAVHLAAHESHLRCLRFLLDHGAHVGIRDVKGRTPLDIAIQRGHVACVRLLLGAGAAKRKRQYQNVSREVAEELGRWPMVPSLKMMARAVLRPNRHLYDPSLLSTLPQEIRTLL